MSVLPTTRRILLGAALVAALPLGAGLAAAETLKIGVTPGPHAQILEQVKPIAAEKGLELEIVEFSDYVVPNEALDAGEIQANSFQNQPYLDNQVEDRGYAIETAALTVNFPLGIYSSRHDTWDAVPEGASIAIQNDPTNGGRSLLLLQDKGVITLKEGVGYAPSVADIVENPKDLEFIEIDAAQTPRALPDVDAAAINTNYAVEAGLSPEQALLREDPKGPYVNILVVRSQDRDAPWVKTLVEAYHSEAVRQYVETQFKGAVLPSW